MTDNETKWVFPDHPIFLGAWGGGIVPALLTNSFLLAFLCASVGALIGAVVYRQKLIEGKL